MDKLRMDRYRYCRMNWSVICLYFLSLIAAGVGVTGCSNGGAFGAAYSGWYNLSACMIASGREKTKMSFDADRDGKLNRAEQNAYEESKYARRWRVGQGIPPEAELTPAQEKKWQAALKSFRVILSDNP